MITCTCCKQKSHTDDIIEIGVLMSICRSCVAQNRDFIYELAESMKIVNSAMLHLTSTTEPVLSPTRIDDLEHIYKISRHWKVTDDNS